MTTPMTTSNGESEPVKPRSLRFTWSMKTTSSRDPQEIMDEIRKVRPRAGPGPTWGREPAGAAKYRCRDVQCHGWQVTPGRRGWSCGGCRVSSLVPCHRRSSVTVFSNTYLVKQKTCRVVNDPGSDAVCLMYQTATLCCIWAGVEPCSRLDIKGVLPILRRVESVSGGHTLPLCSVTPVHYVDWTKACCRHPSV